MSVSVCVCVYECAQEAPNGKAHKSPSNTTKKGGEMDGDTRVRPLKAVATYVEGGGSAISRRDKPRIHGICELMYLAYVNKY